MPDAVLLEWEGVLTDTASARRDALVRALAAEGMRLDVPAWCAHCDGRAPRDAVTSALAFFGRADATLADLVELRAASAFAEQLDKGYVLLPGAREFVEEAQAGSRVAIVTSASHAETEFVLRLAGLDGAVSTIVSVADVLDAPPAPAAHERALEQLGRRRPLHRRRVVAIAPTSSALRAARAAGVRTVAIGAPAHVAIDADGAADAIGGVTLTDLARLAGITATERQR